jgi:hypothetical protein|mmetsp:Transcript_32142/g.72515  ORF Transcript_32142/g.72515 Transcript_32142/m.72515 type:complete len:94 (-) Transcript_32142:485-766(-)
MSVFVRGPNTSSNTFIVNKGKRVEPSRESETEKAAAYPKDVRGTVLMKHMHMRMAYRSPEDVMPQGRRPEVLIGRLKSDITNGFEKIYERSFY